MKKPKYIFITGGVLSSLGKGIASNHPVEWIKDFIGLDNLEYLSLEGMLNSIMLPGDEFCTAYFNGKYPAKLPASFSKDMLEK